MLISLENIQCMIDMIVGAKFLTPSGCLINTSFWINNQKSNMSLTWSCTQRSCILVEGKGEVQDSEWQEKLRRQRWNSVTQTFLSSYHPLWGPLKTNILLGSSKFSGCSTLASSQMPPADVYFYKCCIHKAGGREKDEPEAFTKALWHSAPEIISAEGCPGWQVLVLIPPSPTSKQKPLQFLFTVRSSLGF